MGPTRADSAELASQTGLDYSTCYNGGWGETLLCRHCEIRGVSLTHFCFCLCVSVFVNNPLSLSVSPSSCLCFSFELGLGFKKNKRKLHIYHVLYMRPSGCLLINIWQQDSPCFPLGCIFNCVVLQPNGIWNYRDEVFKGNDPYLIE